MTKQYLLTRRKKMFNVSTAGYTTHGDEQTDAFICSSYKNMHRIGVFDGHGYRGEKFSKRAKQICEDKIDLHSQDLIDYIEMCTKMEMLKDLSQDPKRKIGRYERTEGVTMDGVPVTGGTTASILDILPDGSTRFTIVGDSDGFKFGEIPGEISSISRENHKANWLPELEAIRQRCAELDQAPVDFIFSGNPRRCVFVLNESGELVPNQEGSFVRNIRNEPEVYVNSEDMGNIDITRTIGDFCWKPRLSCKADVAIVEPCPFVGKTDCYVVASGLWDVVEYEEVRKIVQDPKYVGNATEAVNALISYGKDQNMAYFGHRHHDISVVIAYVTRL